MRGRGVGGPGSVLISVAARQDDRTVVGRTVVCAAPPRHCKSWMVTYGRGFVKEVTAVLSYIFLYVPDERYFRIA